MRKDVVAARRRNREKTRKIRRYPLLDRSDGPTHAGTAGIILLTITA
jgi:hypothetical protein